MTILLTQHIFLKQKTFYRPRLRRGAAQRWSDCRDLLNKVFIRCLKTVCQSDNNNILYNFSTNIFPISRGFYEILYIFKKVLDK